MYEYAFERLDCFRLATGVAQWAATIHLPAHRRHVRDQLIRAADSVVLNIAEAMAQPAGDARNNHFRIAQGSAGEALAAALLSGAPGCEQRMEELRRVGAMLHKLAER